MNNLKLSEGALATVMTGGTYPDLVLQVLGNKKILGNADKERYRLLVSDGKFKISFAMIATQLNDKIISGELSVFSIIKVEKYMTSMINNSGNGERRVMIIMDLNILRRGEDVGFQIGNPETFLDDQNAGKSKPTTSSSSFNENSSAASSAPKRPKPMPSVDQNSSSSGVLTVPIASLTPYHNKWVIKARVTNKSAIRTWSNSRGEGKLFSMDLADESGEIRATAFRDTVDKFYELIEIDKVYYISNCQIKLANKSFSNLDNDYEMTFNHDTTVTPCLDETSIPISVYNFQTIDRISELDAGAIVDVIGICKSVSDVQTFQAKTTKRELKKREVVLIDQSKSSVALTLWGNDAETFVGTDQPVIAIRGAKVGEFGGGKNLSVNVSSVMKINPDLEEAHRLRGWYDNLGKTIDTVNISARTGSGIGRTELMTIGEAKERKLGSGDSAEYYQCIATILLTNSNNALYKACPQPECNKKVIDMENGQYRCEKCNREFDHFKYRLILSINIGDWSDNQWVTIFATEAEKLLKMTSQEVGEKVEQDKDAMLNICNKLNFTEHVFRCRVKHELYNDESRLKTVAVNVDPINYKEYNSYLSASIKKLMDV